jgi:hypothetical protein
LTLPTSAFPSVHVVGSLVSEFPSIIKQYIYRTINTYILWMLWSHEALVLGWLMLVTVGYVQHFQTIGRESSRTANLPGFDSWGCSLRHFEIHFEKLSCDHKVRNAYTSVLVHSRWRWNPGRLSQLCCRLSEESFPFMNCLIFLKFAAALQHMSNLSIRMCVFRWWLLCLVWRIRFIGGHESLCHWGGL